MRNIIAILRGITPHEIESIAAILIDVGICKIEIPMNSPDALTSIGILAAQFAGQGIFGAGTVLEINEVEQIAKRGGQMIVSPNCNEAVIRATKSAGLLSYPGVMSPSECFTALAAGADGLKFFPGDIIAPKGLKAMRAVLPHDTDCIAVGGTCAGNIADWHAAGATGFGIGSALYAPGDSGDAVAAKARAIIAAYDKVMP